MKKEIKNKAASVRAKLLNYSKQEKISFDRVLLYYFQERFLYRLSISPHKKKLILKGGALLLALDVNKGRPTKDIDFLAQGVRLDHQTVEELVREIVQIQVEDGVIFDSKTVKASNIREDGTIDALRVRVTAHLESARTNMQIDLGFGDVIVPDPVLFRYPTLLEEEAPELLAYSWETVIAEKFEAMTSLQFVNSRLKDFYDILYLASRNSFEGILLQQAIAATFKKRGLTFAEPMVVFSDKFGGDQNKQTQWQAFLRKSNTTEAEKNFEKIISRLKYFLEPVTDSLAEDKEFKLKWSPERFEWGK